MTIAILHFMKIIVWLVGRNFSREAWKAAAGFHDVDGSTLTAVPIVDDLQPTPAQRWRDDLERREAVILGLMSRNGTQNGAAMAGPAAPGAQAA